MRDERPDYSVLGDPAFAGASSAPGVTGSQLAEDLPEYYAQPPQAQEPTRWQRFRETPVGRALRVVFIPLVFLAAKLKTLLLIIAKVKPLMTVLTMFISIGAYTLVFGFWFALGFVLLLLLHELGHALQLKREGIPSGAPVFIPFMGALITMKQMPHNAAVEARVGLAGPILGSLATLVPLGIWLATGSQFWQALAFIGFFLNLFNLLPVSPLDGGRAMAAVSPWVWVAGFVGLLVLLVFIFSPLLLVIVLLGGMETYGRLRNRKTEHDYYDVSRRTRVWVALVYLALVGLLVWGAEATYLTQSALNN